MRPLQNVIDLHLHIRHPFTINGPGLLTLEDVAPARCLLAFEDQYYISRHSNTVTQGR
jgi:hypothetical protein